MDMKDKNKICGKKYSGISEKFTKNGSKSIVGVKNNPKPWNC